MLFARRRFDNALNLVRRAVFEVAVDRHDVDHGARDVHPGGRLPAGEVG